MIMTGQDKTGQDSGTGSGTTGQDSGTTGQDSGTTGQDSGKLY
jgi:hypothetical protein